MFENTLSVKKKSAEKISDNYDHFNADTTISNTNDSWLQR